MTHMLTPLVMNKGLPHDPQNTIGKHFRHLLDHQAALLHGLKTGRINYRRRSRGTACERDPVAARKRINSLELALGKLASVDETLTLLVVSEQDTPTLSTLGRELDFIASHTTHHLACIALLAFMQGIQAPPDLGVAALTLRHRRTE